MNSRIKITGPGLPTYRAGTTLVELLVALAIFGLLLVLVSFATLEGLRFNARQQATVAAQSKLRRVTGAITQDVRGALFGSVSDQPLAASNNQVSFYVADQGAGYEVINTSTSQFQMVAENDPGIGAGDSMILFDSSSSRTGSTTAGKALVFPVSAALTGSGVYTVPHSSCTSTLVISPGSRILAYGARSLALRHDAATNRLLLTENGTEVPFAFNITDFRVEYIYRVSSDSDGSYLRTETNPTPYRDSSNLVRVYRDAGEVFTLTDLQLVMAAQEPATGNTLITRTTNSQIPLISPNVDDNDDFSFQGIGSC